MKRAAALIVIIVILVSAFPCVSLAQAPAFDDSGFPEGMTAILMEANTGKVLYEKNSNQRIHPASTTKIMTGLLALENTPDITEKITVGSEVDKFGSSSSLLHLYSNRDYSIEDLLYGIRLKSGNDAGAALAVKYGGSIEGFSDMMNEKAKALGMENTHFSNPHGLDIEGEEHFSTAADMAKLAQAAYQNKQFVEIMSTPEHTVESGELAAESQVIYNGNYLIHTPESRPDYEEFLYSPANGMKTGLLEHVDGNDYYGCLVASAEQDGVDLIAAVFGDTTDRSQQRWRSVKSLFQYGFNNYSWVDMTPYMTPYAADEQVEGYAGSDAEAGKLRVNGSLPQDASNMALLDKSTAEGLADGSIELTPTVDYTKELQAPIINNEPLGTVTYSANGEPVYTQELKAGRSIEAAPKAEQQGVDSPGSGQQGTAAAKGFSLTSVWNAIKDFFNFGEKWWMWIVAAGIAAAVVIVIVLLVRRKRESGIFIPTAHRRTDFYTGRKPSPRQDITPPGSGGRKSYGYGGRHNFGNAYGGGFDVSVSEEEALGEDGNAYMSKRSRVRRSAFYYEGEDIDFEELPRGKRPAASSSYDYEMERTEEFQETMYEKPRDRSKYSLKPKKAEKPAEVNQDTREIHITKEMLESDEILELIRQLKEDDDF